MLSAVPVSTKTLRISLVWLVGAVLTIIWLLVNWLWPDFQMPDPLVAAIQTLFMGLALFYDFKFKQDGGEVFDPTNNSGGD